MKGSQSLVVVLFAACLSSGPASYAQAPQPGPAAATTDVRQAISAARKEIESYKAAGGASATADHPAIKWDAALWAYRERYPRSEAAALASAEAVRLLFRAELWDRAHARVESVGFDDPAWERLATPIYEAGIVRKDLPGTIAALSRAAASTTSPSIKAAVLVVVGRAYRRHGDNAAATRSLETATSTAPGTPYAEEAEGLLYEIKYLSVGVQAPPISGRTRNAGTIDPAALRGKPVVLVFWGST